MTSPTTLTDEDRAAALEAWDNCVPLIPVDNRIYTVFAAGLRAGRDRQLEEDARICDGRVDRWMRRIDEDRAHSIYDNIDHMQTSATEAHELSTLIRKSAEPPKGEHG